MTGYGQDGDKDKRIGYGTASSGSYSGAVEVEDVGDVGVAGETGYGVAKRKTWTYSGNQHAWNYFDMESLPRGMASNRLVFRRDCFTLFMSVLLSVCIYLFQCDILFLLISPPSYSQAI